MRKEMINQYKRMLTRYYEVCDNIIELKEAEIVLLKNGFSVEEICEMGVDVCYDRTVIHFDQRNF